MQAMAASRKRATATPLSAESSGTTRNAMPTATATTATNVRCRRSARASIVARRLATSSAQAGNSGSTYDGSFEPDALKNANTNAT